MVLFAVVCGSIGVIGGVCGLWSILVTKRNARIRMQTDILRRLDDARR